MTKYALVFAVLLTAAGCSDTMIDAGTESAASSEMGFGASAGGSVAAKADAALYSVKIENLTSGQPFTPPLVATHRKPVFLFQVGAEASYGLKEIAENGNLEPMLSSLGANEHVMDVVVGLSDPPPVMPGGNVSVEIGAERGAKYLSFASMLICTNDGFTGVDGIRLPKHVGDVVVEETNGYDAGTEQNTEDFANMVPPCPALTGVTSTDPGTGMSEPALAENGVITHHAGIQGGNDLQTGIHGWTDPVARITIERIQ